jgi:integrase
MPTDPTEAASPSKLAVVMAGLPTPDVNPANPTSFVDNEIVLFAAKMKADNYAQETIERYTRNLKVLSRKGNDLVGIDGIKQTIANMTCSDGTKQSYRNAILLYLKYHGIKAELPKYRPKNKMVFIPLENEIDQLISGCKHQLATFLQTLKETAARYGEAIILKWTDIDIEHKIISITPEKGSNPRAIRVSAKLLSMLSTLPHENINVFQSNKETMRRMFIRARKRIAKNLGNPRINQIHFHTLRHWRATTELIKTNNVYAVMKLLGHKDLRNTQRYIGLIPDFNDEWVGAIANNAQEALDLINKGYVYVQSIGEKHLYKKRK